MDRIHVKVIAYTVNGERIIATASKVSLSRKKVEDIIAMPNEEVETWIRETWRRQHFSPWEHSSYTWYADGCSRVCTHQLVRHRMASYTQQSMRYTEGALRDMALRAAEILGVDCPKSPKRAGKREAYECYSKVLDEVKSLDSIIVPLTATAYVYPPSIGEEGRIELAREYLGATSKYYKLLSLGVPREDARFIIPQAVRSRITVTMNARELVQSFLPLRMCTRAQWEIRLVAWKLWRELSKIHPLLFKWAGPRCVYLENTINDPRPLEEFINGRAVFTIPKCPELVPREGIKPCLKYAFESSLRGG